MYSASHEFKVLYNNREDLVFTRTNSAQVKPNINNNNKTVGYKYHKRKLFNFKNKTEK